MIKHKATSYRCTHTHSIYDDVVHPSTTTGDKTALGKRRCVLGLLIVFYCDDKGTGRRNWKSRK